VYRLVNHFVTLADYRTMNIMLNFVKVIVQRLTNCVTSYASINLSEPEEAKVRTGCYTPFTKKLDTTRTLGHGLL
jgi:hypothetical protein